MSTERSVVIVIPARNEARHLPRVLKALARLDLTGHTAEIIVVDNGSDDGTPEIAAAAGVRVIHSDAERVGGVRNAGVEASTAELIGFLDADCLVGERWVTTASEALSDPSIGAVGGSYLMNPNGNWVERTWPVLPPDTAQEVEALPGGSLVMRRQDLERIGGFDETLSAGEDDDLCRKVRESGLKVLSIPGCNVIHLGYPRSLLGIARRQIWHGANQLDVADSVFEPQLLLTHAFLIGIVGILVVGLLWSPLLALGFFALVLMPPFLLAGNRALGHPHAVRRMILLLPIAFAFYVGRSIGLLKNYGQFMTRRLASPRPPRSP